MEIYRDRNSRFNKKRDFLTLILMRFKMTVHVMTVI